MMTLQLDMYQACALGAVVYALGRLMVKKISFLNRYCIPAPVAGGIIFAMLHLEMCIRDRHISHFLIFLFY